jgi:site-specific recombinase XerD
MVSNGVTLEKVAQYLAHSNVAITCQTYARFAPDHLQDAAEILDFTQVRQVR